MTLHPIHSEFPYILGKFFLPFLSVYGGRGRGKGPVDSLDVELTQMPALPSRGA
jgi:hypothetical protein